MGFNDLLEKHENSQGQSVTDTLEQPNAVSAEGTSAPVVPEEPMTPPPAEDTNVPPVEEKNTPEVIQPDYNKFLEESSEGLFKSVDDFKSSLDKVKNFDEIAKERDALKAQTEIDPFANDFVKKYNELVKAGKSQDQINSFIRINQLGDVSELSDYQAKVEKLVQDGYKRDFAERKITKDFNLNIDVSGDHLEPEEIEANKALLEDSKEELRISANADRAALEDLKVKLSDTTDNNADNRALAEAAQIKEYQDKLKPVVAGIAAQYKGLGELNVNGLTGDKAKTMNFEADPEYVAQAEQKLFDYFKDGKTPVNDQTVSEAKAYLDAVWIMNNKEKFAQINYNQGIADAKLAAVDEFENKSGIPVSGLPPVTAEAATSLRDQQRRAARGEDD